MCSDNQGRWRDITSFQEPPLKLWSFIISSPGDGVTPYRSHRIFHTEPGVAIILELDVKDRVIQAVVLSQCPHTRRAQTNCQAGNTTFAGFCDQGDP